MNIRTQIEVVITIGVLIVAGCEENVTSPPDEVTGPTVGSIVLQLEADTLTVNETTQVQATVLSADGDILTDKVVTLLSSDEDIVTVSETGLVTAERPGRATLTAQLDDVAATAVVYVRRAASISVAPSDATLVVDDLLRLAVTVLDVDGDTVVSPTRFSISDRAVVTNGTSRHEFRAVGVGNAVITAETEGLTASVDVEVKPSEVGSVTLLPDSLTIAEGETARLTVIVRDTTGAVIADPQVVFPHDVLSVNGVMVATVDSTGLVTGGPRAECGTGTIIARSRGVNSNTVYINADPSSGAGCWDY